jgi:hypothetical protein
MNIATVCDIYISQYQNINPFPSDGVMSPLMSHKEYTHRMIAGNSSKLTETLQEAGVLTHGVAMCPESWMSGQDCPPADMAAIIFHWAASKIF